MGNNLDLVEMFYAPREILCTECGTGFPSGFDDYDIEEPPEANPEQGHWRLKACCPSCGAEYLVTGMADFTTLRTERR